jgi:hypothetical protein
MATSLKSKAESLAKKITKHYGYGTDQIYVRPNSWGDHGYEIVWESGPYDWAMTVCELLAGYEATDEEYGFKMKPIKGPSGIFVEPGYSFTLCVYTDK